MTHATPTSNERAQLPEHEQSWCDRHLGYVPLGDTQPYEPGSRYLICSACVAEVKADVAGGSIFCPDCNYEMRTHRGGECPDEAAAIAYWGERS